MRKEIQTTLISAVLVLSGCNILNPDASSFSIAQTPTSTISPLLTSTPLDDDILLSELIQTNGGCKLPCFWGITPGITTWKDANQFLSHISHWDDEYLTYRIEGNASFSTDGAILIYIDDKIHDLYNNGIVDYIWVESLRANYLSDVLKELGEPKEIWIYLQDLHPKLIHNKVPVIVYLFYPELGIRLIYQATGEAHKDFIYSCIEGSPYIELWAVREIKSMKDPIGNYFNVYEAQNMDWNIHSLEEATGMTVGEFRQHFVNSNEPICLSTSRELWKNSNDK